MDINLRQNERSNMIQWINPPPEPGQNFTFQSVKQSVKTFIEE